MYKLSISYILKDCAHTIRKSLDSVKWADEIICVDTGSMDGTIEAIGMWYSSLGIINKPALKILHFDWCNDFSKARNFSIDNCTGDYVLILDGDEYLEENAETKIRKAMESGVEIMTMIQWNFLENAEGIEGDNYMRCAHFRLFKNIEGIRYINRSHEILTDEGFTKGNTDVIIYHTGYKFESEADKIAKSERNIKLHLQQLVDEPHNKDVRYNIARAYGNLQRWKEVIEYASGALWFDGLDNNKRSQLAYMLFKAWNNFGRAHTATDYLILSLKLVPVQRMARLALANCLFESGQFDETIRELEKMKSIESELTADLEYSDEFIDNVLISKVKSIKELQNAV